MIAIDIFEQHAYLLLVSLSFDEGKDVFHRGQELRCLNHSGTSILVVSFSVEPLNSYLSPTYFQEEMDELLAVDYSITVLIVPEHV